MTSVTQVADGLGNDNTEDFRLPGGPHQDHIISVGGTLDGATVKLQSKAPDGSYIDVSGGSFTAATVKAIEHLPTLCRIDVDGGGGSVSVDVWVQAGGYR